MDHDTIIRLAREAAFHTPVQEAELLRFAALIHDHLTYSSTHTCHPGCTKPACVAMREAVLAEREECAKVCDEVDRRWINQADKCAAAIRSRT